MSGDVQPRKRKDKKRKREEEEGIHHGVHATKMGTDDIHLHVQSDHETGGHWCAKIFFFSLLAILIGLIGLIIMENRGLADLDTPLSESRFSEYFDGWVDEHRDSHDHDPHDIIAHEIEEHDEHDEPFEEEEDVSTPEEDEEEEISKHDEHDEGDDDHDNDDEEDQTAENDDEDVAEAEDEDEEADQHDENLTQEDNITQEDNVTQEDNATQEDNEDEDENDEPSQPIYSRSRREVFSEQTKSEANADDKTVEETKEENVDEDNDEDNDGDNDEEDDQEDDQEDDENEIFDENISKKKVPNIKNTSNGLKVNISVLSNKNKENIQKHINKEDDATYEKVIENDAEEINLLREKARQAQKESGNYEPEEEQEEQPQSSPQIKPRPGGGPQTFDTEDEFIEEQLRRANEHMLQDNIDTALKIYESLILKYPDSYGALLGKAEALDKLSETLKSNNKLKESITAYKRYLAFGNDIPDDTEYRQVAERCIERMRFLGLISQAVIIHEGLIERFPNEIKLRNNLAVTYLLSNQLKEAKSVLDNVLKLWPNNGFAKVHYGFILKNLDYDLENSVRYLTDGIDSNEDGTQDGRFYFHLGEALQRLNRSEEALEVFRKGAKRKLFPSEYQRSLYNVNNLRAKTFWLKKDFPTDYQEFFSMIERNWRQIREEGIDALKEKNYFINETENLKNTGDWKQFELYSQGVKKLKNCEKTRVTCALIDTFAPARYCKRGQTKFSVMEPGTHVWPHCGPTNCRLRAHLGLKIPNGTKIRVAKIEKTWEEGKFLIFDDSFEHEVWHNGTSPRLILIVDIWHPDLTESQRKNLSPI